jgi:hypothetical protein
MNGPESSTTANQGFGVDPKDDCTRCEGRGFFYMDNWAKTCECKLNDDQRK